MSKDLERAFALAAMQSLTLRWLENCPMWNADAVYETAGTTMERQQQELAELTMKIGDQALSESVHAFVDEGELPMLPNGEDMEEHTFWDGICEMILEIQRRGPTGTVSSNPADPTKQLRESQK